MNRLRLLRKEKNLSIVELSDKVNINTASISRMETGAQGMNEQQVALLSNFFGVTSDYLLGESDSRINFIDNENIKSVDSDLKIAFYGDTSSLDENDYNEIIKYIKYRKETK